jgi:hypothetical protein
MRISRTVTALAAAGLLAATLRGAAGPAATTPNVCTPSWKLVSAPAGPVTLEPDMIITGAAVDRAGDAWFAASDNFAPSSTLSWAYHWDGHSLSETTTVPQGSYTARSSSTGQPFDGPFTGPVSFDSRNDGWMIGLSRHPDSTLTGGVDNPQYAAHWSGGRWTITPLPVSPDPASFVPNPQGVAAVSPADAWAVGYYYSEAAGVAGALIEHWDGTQWSIVPNPASSQTGTRLAAITALSATDVWAVGEQNAGTSTQVPFTEHWDGTSWTVVPAPPAAAPSRFIAVSADSPSDAWAVGSQLEPGTTNAATSLVEHWNGTEWSVVTGLPDLSSSELLAVYAASPSDVWAPVYGLRTDSDLGTDEFLHWDGSSWTTVPVPGPHEYGVDDEYTGITGTGPDNIWAAGYTINPGNNTTPQIAHLSCG